MYYSIAMPIEGKKVFNYTRLIAFKSNKYALHVV